jgi:hypothetical protein
MSPDEQRMKALQRADAKRIALADLRARLRSERGALADVMLDPPELLADVAIVDVVRLAYGKRSARSLQRLGAMAAQDRVNLLMPLGSASLRTREWVARHAMWHWTSSANWGRTRLAVAVTEDVAS